MRRHLTPAGVGIVSGAHGFQQLLVRRHAHGEAERAIAIVGIEPVVARAQHQAGSHQQRFMSGAGDLEENLLLPLEQDLAIVELTRQVHQAVNVDQLLAREPFIFFRLRDRSFGLCLGGCHPLPQG